ncbi:MAG: ATP-grasp domain-containing protein, partial [Bacteroidota bacterium]
LKDVLNIELFGASGKEDHGRFVFKNYIGNVPYINAPDFLKFLNNLIKEFKIDIIFPTHDDVVLKLVENSMNINAEIAVPGIDQAKVCRSKKMTYALFKDYDFCPVMFMDANQINSFPVFAKPNEGQGGKGAMVIKENQKDIIYDLIKKDYVISEYLPGDEITVDCFSDKNGELRFVGPRERNRIFGGISVNSKTIDLTDEINDIALCIHEKLIMNGLWFFQLKKNKQGSYKLLEISLRVSVTMNLYRNLGINFPLLTIYNKLGYEVKIIKNNYTLEVDRALFNRYDTKIEYNTIYIDFDDTITKNGKLNPSVIMFLYHCLNRQKTIKLITRHTQNIRKTLNQLCISPNIFNEIILLQQDEKKYQYIKERKGVIFIDNAFAERIEVQEELNIPVFDVDAIMSLIDWRE